MRSNLIDQKVQDSVIRARSACWVENIYKECVDVSKYPRIGVVTDEQQREVMYGVVAFHKIDSDEGFEILFESEDEKAALLFYSTVVEKLKSEQLVH